MGFFDRLPRQCSRNLNRRDLGKYFNALCSIRGEADLTCSFSRRERQKQHDRPFEHSTSSFHTLTCHSTSCLLDQNNDQAKDGKLKHADIRLPQHHVRFASQTYHSSARESRAAALMLGFGTLAALSYAGAQGVKAYQEFKINNTEQSSDVKQDEDPAKSSFNFSENKSEQDGQTQNDETTTSSSASASASSESSSTKEKSKRSKTDKNKKRENVFKEWFGVGVGSKYYEGGFEETMTRREAALILGVRESSSAARIKDAHRKLLILNHPDTGGSTYISGKINEAKELLIKGKS